MKVTTIIGRPSLMDCRARTSGNLVLGGVALAGCGLLWFTTPWGVGLSPDSAVYIGAARSLYQAKGYSLPVGSAGYAPIVHYPPLYPVVLSTFALFGRDAAETATWLNIILFGANVFIAGRITIAATGRVWTAVGAAVLMIAAFPVVQVHTMAWSEPLFIFLEVCAVLFLFNYLQFPGFGNLFGAAVMKGLGASSRYAGVMFILSGAASIVSLAPGSSKRKISHAGLFLAISSLPLSLWMARNWMLAGSIANRQIHFHPIGWAHLNTLAATLLSWFAGSWLAASTPVAILACLVIALVWLRRSCTPALDGLAARNQPMLLRMMGIIIFSYLLMVFGSSSFFDEYTPIDSRILSPLYPPLVFVTMGFMTDSSGRNWEANGRRYVSWAVLLAIISFQITQTFPWLVLTRREGVGYASRMWRDSNLLKQVKSIHPGIIIYSNAPDVLYILLGQPAAMIPRKINPHDRLQNQQLGLQLAKMRTDLQTHRGVLVYFERVRWRWYLPEAQELETALELYPLYRTPEGVIYGGR